MSDTKTSSTIQVNRLATHSELTENDLITKAILHSPQKELISGLMDTIAQDILNIEITPADIYETIKQQSELKGQLKILQHLLDLSASGEELARLEAQKSQSQ